MNTYDYDTPRKEIYDPDNIASVEKIKEVIVQLNLAFLNLKTQN